MASINYDYYVQGGWIGPADEKPAVTRGGSHQEPTIRLERTWC
jgi:hypothetical protein